MTILELNLDHSKLASHIMASFSAVNMPVSETDIILDDRPETETFDILSNLPNVCYFGVINLRSKRLSFGFTDRHLSTETIISALNALRGITRLQFDIVLSSTHLPRLEDIFKAIPPTVRILHICFRQNTHMMHQLPLMMKALSENTHLKTIRISICPRASAEWSCFPAFIHNIPTSVTTLDLEECQLGDFPGETKAGFELLRPTIQHLNLSSNSFERMSATQLSALFSTLKRVRELNLSCNTLYKSEKINDGIQVINAIPNTVVDLDLSCCFSYCIQDNWFAFKRIAMVLSPLRTKSLMSLSLAANALATLSYVEFRDLMQVLPNSLIELNLSGNNFAQYAKMQSKMMLSGSLNAGPLFKLLPPYLQGLDLSHDGFFDERFTQHSIDSIASLPSHIKHLKLRFQHYPNLPTTIKVLKELSSDLLSLDLSGNFNEPSGSPFMVYPSISSISSLLEQLPKKLERLSMNQMPNLFHSNQVTIATILITMMPPNLKMLDLNKNGFFKKTSFRPHGSETTSMCDQLHARLTRAPHLSVSLVENGMSELSSVITPLLSWSRNKKKPLTRDVFTLILAYLVPCNTISKPNFDYYTNLFRFIMERLSTLQQTQSHSLHHRSPSP